MKTTNKSSVRKKTVTIDPDAVVEDDDVEDCPISFHSKPMDSHKEPLSKLVRIRRQKLSRKNENLKASNVVDRFQDQYGQLAFKTNQDALYVDLLRLLREDLLHRQEEFQKKIESLNDKMEIVNRKWENLEHRKTFLTNRIREYKGKQTLLKMHVMREKRDNARIAEEIKESERAIHKLTTKKTQLKEHITNLCKLKCFIVDTISLLPSDYVRLEENPVYGLIVRFNTLKDSQSGLNRDLQQKTEEVIEAKKKLKEKQHEVEMILCNRETEIRKAYDERERLLTAIDVQRRVYHNELEKTREKVHGFGVLLRNLDNVVHRCAASISMELPNRLVYTHLTGDRTSHFVLPAISLPQCKSTVSDRVSLTQDPQQRTSSLVHKCTSPKIPVEEKLDRIFHFIRDSTRILQRFNVDVDMLEIIKDPYTYNARWPVVRSSLHQL